jgi:hypothetical protein
MNSRSSLWPGTAALTDRSPVAAERNPSTIRQFLSFRTATTERMADSVLSSPIANRACLTGATAAGHREGVIFFRFQQSEDPARSDVDLISLDEVRNHLPKDTPSVSRAERCDMLMKRRSHAARRWSLSS